MTTQTMTTPNPSPLASDQAVALVVSSAPALAIALQKLDDVKRKAETAFLAGLCAGLRQEHGDTVHTGADAAYCAGFTAGVDAIASMGAQTATAIAQAMTPSPRGWSAV